jgi:CSLREA domain-containing protein
MNRIIARPAKRKLQLHFNASLLLLMLSSLLTPVSFAATFVVDSTSDVALSACTAAPDDCSLRGAITAANVAADSDQIDFNIPSTDSGFQAATQHWLILVGNTSLPTIENQVVIDGYSQPGALANANSPDAGGLNSVLKIEIRPSASAGSQVGLQLVGNNFALPASIIRGLTINRFFSQIQLGGSGAHRVEGCYLGTDISGSVAAVTTNSGRGVGVRVQGPGPYQIGGLLPAERNLMSGMFSAIVFQSGSDGIRIQGNLIGTTASGVSAVGNTNDAISSAAPIRNARIGGDIAAARNVIAASSFAALRLSSQSLTDFSGTLIEGNYIGTDVSGTRALGNGLNPSSPSQVQPSILVGGVSCALSIGGLAPGQANLIAYSGGAGISNDQCPRIQTPLNRFYGNRGIPFDNVFGGGAIGATPNDLADVDEVGGNRLQNFPELSLPAIGSDLLSYRVDTAVANATYPITMNFYRAGCGGGSDAFLGSATISAAQAQQALTIDVTTLGSYLPLTATAVDAVGNTSEFAPALGDDISRSGFEDQLAPLTSALCR